MIIVLDFGSQTTHLISRRIKELGTPVKILPAATPFDKIIIEKPQGLILSGGPAAVFEKGAPHCDLQILQSGLPILGICYGFQLLAHLLGGKVEKGLKREYGPAKLELRIKPSSRIQAEGNSEFRIIEGLPKEITAWMSHGDEVVKLPPGFKIIGSTADIPFAFAADEKRKIYGVQFHPEVTHTPQGSKILKNFVFKICQCPTTSRKTNLINTLVSQIKNQVGKEKAVCALSGGVDSSVAAILSHKALGKNLTCIYIDTGLMRQGETNQLRSVFKKHFLMRLRIIKAKNIFLKKLAKVQDPEKKRKIIGETFIRVLEKEAEKIGASFLVQGTIYPDVIESQGTTLAAKIKTHHNVGGLPSNHRFKLVEPLRFLYKDEVRKLAKKLGLPQEIIFRQVFPGPGLAIRIMGEVTKKKLEILQKADFIVAEEIKKSGFYEKLWMSFAIFVGVKTTAVMGDARIYGEAIALRALKSQDAMTADFARLPYPLLAKISSRIVNEVSGVSRVVYDITSKPPATMEWE